MRRGKTGVQLERAAVFAHRPRPVPIVHVQHPGQRRVRLGYGVVQRERLEGVLAREPIPFGHGDAAVIHLKRVGVREPRVRERVFGVVVDCLFEVRDRLEHALLRALVPAVSALQVERVRLEVVRVALRRGIRDVGQEGGAQRGHDRARDLVLQREHVVELAIVPLRPDVAPVVRRRELRGDAQAVVRLPDCALEHDGHAEQGADGANILRLAFEGEDRRTRGDAQAFDLGERVDQLVRDAIAQVFVVRIHAGVHERQHGDRPRLADESRRRHGGSRVFERGHELRDAREPVGRCLGERAGQRALDRSRRVGTVSADRPCLFGQVTRDDGAGAVPRKGWLARQGLVDHAGEPVHVAARVELAIARRLLRAHVLRSPDGQTHLGDVLARRPL